MLLMASRNHVSRQSRDTYIMYRLSRNFIWNDTTHLSRSSGIHTYMYVHVYTDCFRLRRERGSRSRNIFVVIATEGKERGRRYAPEEQFIKTKALYV